MSIFLIKFKEEINTNMNNIQLEIKGKRIDLYGSNAVIQSEKSFIENLDLTGDEHNDRLLIQKCIDDNKLKSDILYTDA